VSAGQPSADEASERVPPRKDRMLLLVVIALVSLIALVALAISIVRPAVRAQRAANVMAVDTRGLERVAWAGDGRFAVVQDFERDGTPVVSAWDRQSGRLQRQRGWLWLRTEETAAAIWVIPMTAKQVAAIVNVPGDARYPLTAIALTDAPAPGLARWDFYHGPPAPGARAWRPVAGGRASAEFGVDAKKGSAPFSLGLRQSRPGGVPVGIAKQVEGSPFPATVNPLGWSASGDLFALRVLDPAGGQTGETAESLTEYYLTDGTRRFTGSSAPSASASCWAGSGNYRVASAATKSSPYLVTAQDLMQPPPPTEVRLAEIRADEGPPALLGPAGKWVLIGVNAARGARQYDEITAPGQRRRLLLIPRDPSAQWTEEAWQEGAGLLRLGVAVSPTGQVQTRVMLYRPGASRPRTVYRGPKRLATEGK
jgi:hypothetical protein